jgi:hypothetical protein
VPSEVASAISSVMALVEPTARTWRSVPAATSPTAWAISLTARPVSSDTAAICWEADETVEAVPATWPMRPASASREAL